MTKKNQNQVFKTIKEYAENTTIHGIQYIFENGASVYEKISWIFVVLGGIIFAAILSLQGLQKSVLLKVAIKSRSGVFGHPCGAWNILRRAEKNQDLDLFPWISKHWMLLYYTALQHNFAAPSFGKIQ